MAKRLETAKPDTKIRFVEVGSETADLVIAGGAKPKSQVSARLFAQVRLVIVREAGYECTISVGVASMRNSDESIEVLIGHADKAMYSRKQTRRWAYLN